LLDTHFPGSTEPNPKPKPYSKKTKLKVVDLEHNDVSFITKAKLIEAFSLFGPLKSAGPDDIKPIVLQHLPDKLLDNLIILYKVSIALGYSHKRWTDSKVIFIPKIGKESFKTPNSFRPISLCSFILKGLERLILFHLEENHLIQKPLSSAQHAFRRGKGCDTALSEAVDTIEKDILHQQYTIGIFMDIAGAFSNLTFSAATNAMRKCGLPHHIIQ
jgi:hypothetical protein